ncbi:MAG: 50S ribosomal protein L10 [Clostridia bacterium]|nr:50S ribosomal protein L10 [Clostridia bacterium]
MPSAKVLEQKKTVVAELTEKMQNATAGVFVDYRGLTVEEDTNLRVKLREAGVEYKVVKNTLTRFAANQIGYEALDPILNGPTALALSDDPVAPAKVLAEFAKTNPNLEIKAGFLDGSIISIEEITKLAATPSRDTLIAKIMGSLNAPISNLARTLQALVDGGVEPAEAAAKKAGEAAPAEEAAPAAEAAVEEAPAAEEAPAEAPAEETAE